MNTLIFFLGREIWPHDPLVLKDIKNSNIVHLKTNLKNKNNSIYIFNKNKHIFEVIQMVKLQR